MTTFLHDTIADILLLKFFSFNIPQKFPFLLFKISRILPY